MALAKPNAAFAGLHDATMRRLSVDWAAAELTIELVAVGSPPAAAKVVLGGLTELLCPRREPWGPSVSVNQLTVTDTSGGVRLVIEMQSGDLIEATAGTCSIR